jgi:RimJ/RimL family protein N-acetyltransferase
MNAVRSSANCASRSPKLPVMTAYFERPVLAGRHVRLEPLTLDHAEGLLAAGKDPGVWTWLAVRQPGDLPEVRAYVSDLLARHEAQQQVTWAQIDAQTGEVAGVTAYHDVVPKDRGLYIGSTWIGRDWHRTGVNTEAKLMLMERAFETLGVIRVGWMTHHENLRSQRAIERLGAKRDGVLRNHKIMPDGSIRHSHVYSITDAEWPAARDALRARLQSH